MCRFLPSSVFLIKIMPFPGMISSQEQLMMETHTPTAAFLSPLASDIHPHSAPDPQRTSHLVTRGPVPLYAEAYGDPGAAQRVLCVHGAWQSLHCWHRLAFALAGAGCYVVLWDLPFHGLSGPVAEEPVSAGLWATSMQAMIEEFDLSDVVVVAWSFGGMVVGDYLRQCGSDGIAGLVLIATALFEHAAEQTWMHTLLTRHPFFAATSTHDRQARLAAVPSFFHLLTASPQQAEERHHSLLTMQHAAWRSGAAFILGRTTPAPLPDLTHMPVLAIAGEADPLFPPEVVQATSVMCPSARQLLYPCGHAPMLECPHLFHHDVTHFLEALRIGARP
jgi:pimeloyl-ACP methyl ester carboxylesterase